MRVLVTAGLAGVAGAAGAAALLAGLVMAAESVVWPIPIGDPGWDCEVQVEMPEPPFPWEPPFPSWNLPVEPKRISITCERRGGWDVLDPRVFVDPLSSGDPPPWKYVAGEEN